MAIETGAGPMISFMGGPDGGNKTLGLGAGEADWVLTGPKSWSSTPGFALE